MFGAVTGAVAVPVVLVSVKRVSVILLPSLGCEVRQERVVRVGVSLLVEA